MIHVMRACYLIRVSYLMVFRWIVFMWEIGGDLLYGTMIVSSMVPFLHIYEDCISVQFCEHATTGPTLRPSMKSGYLLCSVGGDIGSLE